MCGYVDKHPPPPLDFRGEGLRVVGFEEWVTLEPIPRTYRGQRRFELVYVDFTCIEYFTSTRLTNLS